MHYLKSGLFSFNSGLFSLLGFTLFAIPTYAQLTPDSTLGTESSLVIPNTDVRGLPADLIQGGAARGANLYHSFSEFNISDLQRVYFANPAGIDSILTRITGVNPSNILGTLGVDGAASLFLLNPHGILFGPNAKLDIAGSFTASTADSFLLPDGSQFSATNPQAPPLLTVNVAIGLQAGNTNPEAWLTNRANLTTGGNLALQAGKLDVQGQLQSGNTLTLTAQDSLTIRDSASQPFIAVAGGALTLQGNAVDIFALNHPGSGFWSGGDLTLRSPNPVIGDAHFSSGGNVRIEQLDGSPGDLISPNDPVIRASGDVTFTSYTGASLHIFAGGSVTANSITITNPDLVNGLTETVTLSDGTTTVAIDGRTQSVLDIRAGTTAFNPVGTVPAAPLGFTPAPPGTGGVGTSADITLGTIAIQQPNGLVVLTNQYQPNTLAGSITLGSVTNVNPAGGGGNLIMDSRNSITVNGGLSIASGVVNGIAQGNGGNATLIAGQTIRFNPGSQLLVDGLLGGSINLTANDAVALDGSLLRSRTLTEIPGGGGGDLTITTGSLSLTNGSRVIASTFSRGDAGRIAITARDQVRLDGVDTNGTSSLISSTVFTGAEGKGGGIAITTGSLTVSNEAFLTASTFGSGNAGNIVVDARDQVVFDNGQAFSAVDTGVEGRGGDIAISTGSLSVINGAVLQTSTLGKGDAGAIAITARDQVLFDGSSFASSSVLDTGAEGNSGGITIAANTLTVMGGSFLSSSTTGKGDAGDITITALDRANFQNGNLLTTVDDTAEGNGGEITITTASLFAQDAFLLASTFGNGDAGAITITARDQVVFDNVSVSSSVSGETAQGQAGNLTITAASLFATNDSFLSANTFGQGDAGSITITVRDQAVFDNSNISTVVFDQAEGKGGDIVITASSLALTNNSFLSARTSGKGNAGGVTIDARDQVVLNDSALFSNVSAGAAGNGGGITITTNSLSVTNDTQLIAGTDGKGNAGNITINARDQVQFDNSDAFSDVGTGAEGTGGSILITTGSLSVINGAQLIASTDGKGDAGTVTITASNQVRFDGTDGNGFSSAVFSSVRSNAEGNAGGVFITVGSLFVTNEALLAADTFGKGDAGNITITASDQVIFDSTNIFSTVDDTAEGKGGNITITAGALSLLNGAQLNTDSDGKGDAGNVTITVRDQLRLDGENSGGFPSAIFSSIDNGADGDGGDISLTASSIAITNGARLSTSTFSSGNAGNITLTATEQILLDGIDRDGSPSLVDSLAGVGATGNGGIITLTTRDLTISNGARLNASTNGKGNAGEVSITASDLIVLAGVSSSGFSSGVFNVVDDGAEGKGGQLSVTTGSLTITGGATLSAGTFGKGDAGSVIITARNQTRLDGIGSNSTSSGVYSTVGDKAEGNGGGVLVTTGSLTLTNGGQLSASTDGKGDAGTVTVVASEFILLDGVSSNNRPSGTFSSVNPGAVGNAGGIKIITESLTATNGAELSASTFGKGNASSITIIARDQILFDGVGANGFSSGAFSTVSSGAEGTGGEVDIITGSLTLTNGGELSAGTFGKGDAGSVTITARDQVRFDGVGSNNRASGAFSVVGSGAEGNGGDIEITSNSLTVSNGARLEASTSGKGDAGSVSITAFDKVVVDNSRIFSSVEAGGEGNGGGIEITTDSLTITNRAFLNASTFGKGDAGSVIITAYDQAIFNGSFVASVVFTGAEGNGGGVEIATDSLAVLNGTQLRVSTFGKGDAGSLTIIARDQVAFDNSSALSNVQAGAEGNGGGIVITTGSLSVTNKAQLNASTNGAGNAGNISITARDQVAFDDSFVVSFVLDEAEGNAGGVEITTGSLSITNRAILGVNTFGKGNAGSITINAFDQILLDGNGRVLSAVEAGAEGTGGDIAITTGSLSLSNRALLSASTSGKGDAGSVTITARDQITFDNSAAISLVSNGAEGTGGGVVIAAGSLMLTNAAVAAGTLGKGNAGSITVAARDQVVLDGSFIDSSVELGAEGIGGDIAITTSALTISNRSVVGVNSQGTGQGGNIFVQAGNLTLFNQGGILAETATTQGGNIDLQVQDVLLLRNNSRISTTAGTTQAGGDGGNIRIAAAFVIGVPQENSDITANAFAGNGGRVEITAQGILGLEFRSRLTPLSDITASSEQGAAGIVTLNVPNTDPGAGLIPLPDGLADASNQIAQACKPGQRATSSFVNIGRGGIPETPYDSRSTDEVWEDLGGGRSAESGGRGAELGVRSTEFGVRSAESGGRSTEFGVRGAESGVRSLGDGEMGSEGEVDVRTIKCGVGREQ